MEGEVESKEPFLKWEKQDYLFKFVGIATINREKLIILTKKNFSKS